MVENYGYRWLGMADHQNLTEGDHHLDDMVEVVAAAGVAVEVIEVVGEEGLTQGHIQDRGRVHEALVAGADDHTLDRGPGLAQEAGHMSGQEAEVAQDPAVDLDMENQNPDQGLALHQDQKTKIHHLETHKTKFAV